MRTKRRSKRKVTAIAFAGLLLLNVIALVAFTKSTTPPEPESSLAGQLVLAPENESAEAIPGRATPDELLDLKKGSNAEVSEAMVRRMQAQAAEVAPAAMGLNWKQLGPYNIGGRVPDIVAD